MRLTRRERLSVLGIWVALGLLESGKAYVQGRFLPQPPDWASVLVGNMPWWLVWAALTPVAIALARRRRFDRGVGRALVVHVPASIVIALAHHIVVGTLYYFTHTRGRIVPIGGELVEMTLPGQFRLFFGGYFVLNVITYWALVGGYLGLEFFKRYRAGEVRAARLEASMHEARLAALRMELNPHFLFNTLNAVSGLVRRRDNDDAVRMLARLAELLRSTLEQGSDAEIPLERELEALATYLDIERIRFGPRLSIRTAVDSDIRHALVPPLLLQPLVENAVRHGVARHAGPGVISIRVRRDDDVCEITITNSGPTAGDGTDAGAPPGRGIGLENTRERLAELYGDAAGLRLERRPDGGARVVVRLPLRSGGAAPGGTEREGSPGATARPVAQSTEP